MLENIHKHNFGSVLQLLGGKLCRNPKYEVLNDWFGDRLTRLVQFPGPWYAEIVEDSERNLKWIRLGHTTLPESKISVIEEAMAILCNHAYHPHMQFIRCDDCKIVTGAKPCLPGQELILASETCPNCK